jgi:hypothetical protein
VVSSVFTDSTIAVALIFDCSDIRAYTSGGITPSAEKQKAAKRKTSTEAATLQFFNYSPSPVFGFFFTGALPDKLFLPASGE